MKKHLLIATITIGFPLLSLLHAAPGKMLELNLEPSLKEGGVRLTLIQIPAGSFMMGSEINESGREDDEGPQREVTLSQAFYMGIYEVTQEQYQAVMGENPSHFSGPKRPVENVTWFEAMAFCEKLSELLGMKVTLPTEAQWEYACRARSKTRYCFGDDAGGLGDYAWHMGNGEDHTHPVGLKKANAFGLYDMHGNAWEWCRDWYAEDYMNLSTLNPVGPGSGMYRVVRGGSFHFIYGTCRSADRDVSAPKYKYNYLGFRVVIIP